MISSAWQSTIYPNISKTLHTNIRWTRETNHCKPLTLVIYP